VGNSNNATQIASFEVEKETYQDVIQLDARDTYDSLTYKTVELLKYMETEVQEYDFLMKIDDDTFVRVDRLVQFLSSIPKEKSYAGRFH
jgi:hypothetical protein